MWILPWFISPERAEADRLQKTVLAYIRQRSLELPVKSYAILVAALVLVVASVATSYFTASGLESPQRKLERSIDEQVELAQRMLFEYEPAAVQLALAVTQPADVSTEAWLEYQRSLDDAEQPLGRLLQQQDRELTQLRGKLSKLGGEEPPRQPQPSAADAYRTLQQELEVNSARIEKALRTVQKAIQMSRGSGDTEVRGSGHPAATRLEAVLIYHQVDLLRRRASVLRSRADEERRLFADKAARWRDLAIRIRGLEIDLAGEQASAHQDSPTTAPAELMTNPIPSLADRIAALQTRRAEVVSSIQAAQENARQAGEIIADLERRIFATTSKAAEAEKRMLSLEDAGIDATDPDSINRFATAYSTAAQTYREASKEAAILEYGFFRNARPNTENEDAITGDLLVSVDPDKEMVPERGLAATQTDLLAAERLATDSHGLLKEIDRQIADLMAHQDDLKTHITQLRNSQENLAKQAKQHVATAIATVIEADELETQAIDLANGPGQQAAQRAKRAANQWRNDARQQNAENPPGTTNRRLKLISEARFVAGHAQVVEGDLASAVAMLQAERAQDMKRHRNMLMGAMQLGLRADELLPKEMTIETVPALAFKTSAAKKDSNQSRKAALTAAKRALEVYTEADADLGQLWVLHTNIAAVRYLLASLSPKPEADKQRKAALQEYQRGIRDQADQPEMKVYRRIIDKLTAPNP